MSHFSISSAPHTDRSDVMVVSLQGHLDESNLSQLRETMQKHMQDHHVKRMILDMQDLEFLNSRVIGFLISVYAESLQHKTRLALFRPSMPIALILQRVGVDKLYPLFHKMDEALASLDQEDAS